MRYLFGATLIVLGIAMIWKTAWLIQTFGRVAWAEYKLGGGGTWIFHKIVGIIAIIFGTMIMSGRIVTILDWIF